MEARCTRGDKCEAISKIGCSGCGFQHFEKICLYNKENQTIKLLCDKFFRLCSEQRQGPGGRVSLDRPIKELFKEKIRELKELSSDDLKVELEIGGEKVNFKIKCDGAFNYNKNYIFYEVKGYGDNTNDVLSAITAAQLLKEIPKFKNSVYYYIGINSGKKGYRKGLKRDAFLNQKRKEVYPYVYWAENKGFLKFFGILDIDDIINEIKSKS